MITISRLSHNFQWSITVNQSHKIEWVDDRLHPCIMLDETADTSHWLCSTVGCFHRNIQQWIQITHRLYFPLSVLDSTPGDPKALFRRCQAQEQLGSHEAAYKDAMLLMRVDPKNTAVQPILRRLNPIIQDKVGWTTQCQSINGNILWQ